MGFLTKLFGGKKEVAETASATPAMTFPTTVEVIPEQLSVKVFSHSVENVPGAFWSFVSVGLKAYGQREIALTLLRRRDEPESALPRAPFAFFAQVLQLAQQHQPVGPGEWSEFGPAGFLAPNIRGLAYATAQPIRGVDMPTDALAGILLNSIEMEVAKACGVYRVLSRLGQAASAYPFPFWCDRDRPNLVPEGADHASMLQKVARIRIKGVSLRSQDQKLTMLVPLTASKEFEQALEQVPPGVGLAFLAEPAHDANGWLVWVPGQKEPAAITPPGSNGSRLTGFHLVVAPGVDADSVRIGEDGFWMLMRAESWERFKKALQGQGRFELPAVGDSMGFELTWIETEYRNPVDGSIIRSEGWHEYRPSGGSRDPREQVRLLVSESDMQAAVAVDSLAKYISQISAVVAETLRPASGPRRTVYLQFELTPSAPPVLKTACEPRSEVPEAVAKQLAGLSAPEVHARVAFQLVVQAGAE
jgi:hypothetical protein